MRKTFLLVIGILFLAHASAVNAATFFLGPSSGSYAVGDRLTAYVYVDSSGVAINAVSGTIDFPSNLLSLTQVSKSGSVVNFWTVDPAADASSVHYEGVILNPGYTGARGLVLTLTFQVKAIGDATLSYHSSAILANDGMGTNVLTSTSGASYTLTAQKQVTQTTLDGLPSAPVVTSSTHPNQNDWYQNNTPLISWIVPDDTLQVGLVVDQNQNTTTGLHSYGRITGYNVETLSDGVWYAHVRFLNSVGWGPTTSYRLGIDTIAPSNFSVVQATNPSDASRALFNLSAKDSGSGIDHYVFSIDGGSPVTVPVADTWQTPVLSSGDHSLMAEVFDKAGNSVKLKYAFTTSGISTPTIDTYPKELKSGQTLTVSGHSYPSATITMTVVETHNGITDATPVTATVTADSSGVFTYTHTKNAKSGSYALSAMAQLGNYESLESSPVTVNVVPSFFERIIEFLTRYVIVLFLLFLALLAYVIYRYRRLKQKVSEDLAKMNETVKAQIGALAKGTGEIGKEKDMVFLEKLEVDIENAKLDGEKTAREE